MMDVVCRTKAYKGQMVNVDLSGEMIVVSINGTKLLEAPPLIFFAQLTAFPSFGGNVKYFRVAVGDGYIELDPDKQQLAGLKNARDITYAKEVPGFHGKLRIKAIGGMLLGIACIVGGIFLTIMSLKNPDQGGKAYILWGLPVFGLAALTTGFVKFRQAANIKRLSNEHGLDANAVR